MHPKLAESIRHSARALVLRLGQVADSSHDTEVELGKLPPTIAAYLLHRGTEDLRPIWTEYTAALRDGESRMEAPTARLSGQWGGVR